MVDEVTLRDVQQSDLAIFYEQQADAETVRMGAFPSRNLDDFMAHWEKILADDTNIIQSILFNGEVVGHVVNFALHGRSVVGYCIAREHWGKGIATRALSALLERIPTRPLYGHVAKHNVGSIRVLEKCGFTISGEGFIPTPPGAEPIEEWVMELS